MKISTVTPPTIPYYINYATEIIEGLLLKIDNQFVILTKVNYDLDEIDYYILNKTKPPQPILKFRKSLTELINAINNKEVYIVKEAEMNIKEYYSSGWLGQGNIV